MGLFKKKQYYVDEAGNVVEGAEPGTRDIDDIRRAPKIKTRLESKQDRAEWKKQQREIYQQEFRKARLERIRKEARQAGHITLGDRLEKFSRGVGSPTPHKVKNNYNPFGSMFDTGIGYKGSSKPRIAKTKYKVISGKAYPIASYSKRKKKGKRRSSSGFGGFDMTDNWGLMK